MNSSPCPVPRRPLAWPWASPKTAPGGPLAESWNGIRWSVVPTPNPGIIDHVLNGVSCASQNFCMAAGWFFSNPTYRTLTLVGTAAG